ncbi:peptide chain release factor N(5)-glutamine methyltransferase [Phytohalomonas tamaricis]|uniref:peptide chain release factor N(5)-glutamine methyltransferase n=1 Tax=Phytohalomonas tamaricis TaxID=2081032 RepID=UPI000D0B0901|nr:peptide chain release factor N(5)-glutamine methyltransferase [Phytohalomonas tamaricis]
MRIDQLLVTATQRLVPFSDTPRLDAELLLAYLLERERVWLYTWGDREVEPGTEARFHDLLAAREQGQPIAYLIGQREFWGLMLSTSKATLIPRPDTELLVEEALKRAQAARGRLLDLGTGTGAIALALASERPQWSVFGVDIIEAAVQLARTNATRLGMSNVHFMRSDWFSAFGENERFDIIVSNPPYLADSDPHLERGDVRFEPRSALIAAQDGLADLYHLARSAQDYLEPGGWLLVEHGMAQGEAVQAVFRASGFIDVETCHDLGGRPRVTLGHVAHG